MKVKINKDIIASELTDKIILFYSSNDKENKIYELEKSAATIWRLISEKDLTLDELHQKLSKKYDSYTSKDQKDTEDFLNDLKLNKILI